MIQIIGKEFKFIMSKDVNGIVYLVGKEKAIINGFFGKTINPDIVFLFVNKNGMKYYINNDILRGETKEDYIIPGKFYELRRIERGRRFFYKETNKKFDSEVIEKVKLDDELNKNFEFNLQLIKIEFEIQKKINKRKNFILDIMWLLIILIIYALTQNVLYSIPFILLLLLTVIYMYIYNRKMVKELEKVQRMFYSLKKKNKS